MLFDLSLLLALLFDSPSLLISLILRLELTQLVSIAELPIVPLAACDIDIEILDFLLTLLLFLTFL